MFSLEMSSLNLLIDLHLCCRHKIVIQGEEELLQEDVGDDLLQEVGGDHLVSGWVSCPLCSASFLKVTPIDRFIHNILLTLFCLLIFF